jgi:hypothetical protein
MEWYEYATWVVGLFGGLGGVSGAISWYNAKSNKDTIDISNFHSLIEEERRERELLRKEHYQYKEEVNKKIASVKKEFEALKEDNQKKERAILQAYRCTLPKKLMDCPVIRMFQEGCACIDCDEEEETE